MNRRDLMLLLGGAAMVVPVTVHAQKTIPVIGVLMGSAPSVEAAKLGVFRDTLKQLGYIEDHSIVIAPSYAEGNPDRLPTLAGEIVARAPAAIVCVGHQELVALKAATHTIPIVFLQIPNPVEMGFVATLARPGGNVTGFTRMSAEIDSKRLELLSELVPALSRAVFLIDPILTPGIAERFAAAEALAKTLGITLRRVDAGTSAELIAALATIDASDGALLVQNDPVLTGTERARILAFAIAHRLPTIFESKISAVRGGLLSYGPDLDENYRRAAGYVVKILNGAKPADLPVQQPTKFELIINMKTARDLGLTIPQLLLARADEVIE